MEIKNELELINSISGKQAILVKIAIDALGTTRNIEIEKYELKLYESPASWLLLFKHRGSQPGYRGSSPESPSYEVEINKKDNSVLRVNGVR